MPVHGHMHGYYSLFLQDLTHLALVAAHRLGGFLAIALVVRTAALHSKLLLILLLKGHGLDARLCCVSLCWVYGNAVARLHNICKI